LLLGPILSKRVSPLAALVCFPVAASLMASFGLQTGHFILNGIETIGPSSACLLLQFCSLAS